MAKPGTEIREHLIRSLHADLIGPFDLDNPRAVEVLPLAPSRWHLTGFLAPKQARVQDDDPTADEDSGAGVDSSEDDDADAAGNQAMPKAKLRLPASLDLCCCRVSLADLEALRELVGRGRLRCPISRIRLSAVGLERIGGLLGALQGKDRDGVLELLELVVRERRGLRRPTLDLVWTGPEAVRSATRSTAAVVREMFERASRSVAVAGFAFDDVEILRPLHAAMAERGVQVRMFVNIPSADIRKVEDIGGFVRAYFGKFWRETWPFGQPWPEVYYDPRQTTEREFVSLHAKCIVVDEREALLTSANFTTRGQTRNIELGVRIEDAGFARAVAAHWHALVAQGLVVAGPV